MGRLSGLQPCVYSEASEPNGLKMPKTFQFLKGSLAGICHKFKANYYNHPDSNEANEIQLVTGWGIVCWW